MSPRTAIVACLSFVCTSAVFSVEEVAAYKQLSLEALMNLEVTSVSRRPEKFSDAASSLHVITGEEIDRSGASSLPEALRLASNLSVAQISSSNWAISARGFNSTISNKLLVLIDGRTVYTPLFAGVFWDVQSTFMADIDRIEVISGPGGALWGANAVNGVINITTKTAKDTQGLLLSAAAGTELRAYGGFRYGGELAPNLHYRVYGKYIERDSAVFPDGSDADNDWHLSQSGMRVDWEASPVSRLTFQGDIYEGDVSQPGPGDVQVSGGNLLGRWTRTLSPDSDLMVQLYYDHTKRSVVGSTSDELDTYDLDTQHRFILGERQSIVWGLGYRWTDNHVSNSGLGALLPADLQQDVFSGFFQDEITLVPERMTLAFGAKAEHNDYTGWEFQPSTRLTWKPSPRQTVWSAVSRAVRTPSRVDRDLYAPATPPFTLLQGGPDFESEKLIAYELGYRVRPTSRLSLTFATFYNDYDDLRSIELASPPAPAPLFIGNGLEGYSYGVEISADYHVNANWRLQAGFTRTILHLTPKPGSTDTGGGATEANDSENQFFLRSSMNLPGRVKLDLNLRHIGEISRQGVPSYEELDVRIAWQATRRLELSLVGQNLLDAQHPEFGDPASRQEIERGMYAKLQWSY